MEEKAQNFGEVARGFCGPAIVALIKDVLEHLSRLVDPAQLEEYHRDCAVLSSELKAHFGKNPNPQTPYNTEYGVWRVGLCADAYVGEPFPQGKDCADTLRFLQACVVYCWEELMHCRPKCVELLGELVPAQFCRIGDRFGFPLDGVCRIVIGLE